MKTVYFHIGYHRTGTTFFQSNVSKQRGKFATKGCLIPDAGFDGVTHSYLALCLPSKRVEMNQRMRSSSGVEYELDHYSGPPATKLYESLANELRESTARIALVSSECFLEWLDIESFHEHLEAAGIRAEFMVFLRRQDRWIESVYSQVIKDPHLSYAGSFEDLPQHGQLDYNAEIGRWIACFGFDRFHVRFYEEGAHPMATTKQMLSIMGSGSDWFSYAASPGKDAYLNASLDECCVEILRILNPRSANIAAHRNVILKASNEFLSNGEFRNWRLPRQRSAGILKKHLSSNLELFTRLGIEPPPNWGELPKSAYSSRQLRIKKYRHLLTALRPELRRREWPDILWQLVRAA